MILNRRWFSRKNRSPIINDSFLASSLEDYLSCSRPQKNNTIEETQLVAVDFETTGLNSRKDEIISMGFCPIENGVIKLAHCTHILVRPNQALSSDNVAIHGLTDDQVNEGTSPQSALAIFLQQTKGKVIIAHFHTIERAFIQRLAKQLIGMTIPLSVIDTFWIAKLKMQQNQQAISADSLRLFNLRKNIGLPNYKAHNALEDAISTAELFLAQKSHFCLSDKTLKLKQFNLFSYRN